MALSKSESKKEVSNLACIARILLGPCTDTLRDVLTHSITPSDFRRKIRYILGEAFEKKELFIGLDLLIHEYDASYSDFDIPLLYFFLQRVFNIHFPQPELRPLSSAENRRLSANIKRIYKMHKKYKYFQGDFLKDSAFERDWKKLFQTVKDMEKYIGSATANQDAMKKIKNSSMDPDVEHLFIANLGQSKRDFQHGEPPFPFLWTDIETKKEAQVYASRSIEAYLESFGESSLHLEEALANPGSLSDIFQEASIQTTSTADVDEGSGIMEELHIDQTKIMETGDIPFKKYEEISSETLKETFNSFKLDFPADVPGHKSFARKILEDDINRLVTAIQSLSCGIVLTTQTNAIKRDSPQVEACVFEVDVIDDEDRVGDEEKFCVLRKETSLNMLFETEGDTRVRVIRIRSDSLPVVSTKLIVYKNFKHVINEKGFFLQHEYDEIDDLAKLIAYRVILSFCSSIESLINAFTVDLPKSMADYFDKQLTLHKPLRADKIRIICSDVLEKMGYKPFESAKSTRNWSSEVTDLIQSKLLDDELNGADAWDEIKKTCCKTVKDLRDILDRLEKFQANELQVDQKQQIKEWFKADIFPNRFLLHEYPSIIKYLAGYRHKKEVVKVYLSRDDDRAKFFFMDNCKVSKETHFEFINVEERKVKKEDEENEDYNRKVPAVAESTKEDLMQIIRENGEKILAKYSNVIGIRMRQTKPYRITLHCLDKTIIPFGEHPLPNSIAGKPCYVKEDFFILGTCPLECTNDLPEPGCSIGVPEKQGAGSNTGVPAKQGAGSSIGAGSVGFFYESNERSRYGSGFITASHVAIENRYQSRYENKLLSNYRYRKGEPKLTHNIVHPKCKNHMGEEHIVGEVVESFFGKYALSKTFTEGLDFAVVKTISQRQGKKEVLQFVKREKLANEVRVLVTKTGKTTKKTYGYLTNDVMLADISIPGFLKKISLPELCIVENRNEKERFFEKGDSGSGVFVVDEDQREKVLGIGIAVSDDEKHEAYVCKIDKIVTNMALTLVRYTEDNHKETSPNTENSFKENKKNPCDWFSEFPV